MGVPTDTLLSTPQLMHTLQLLSKLPTPQPTGTLQLLTLPTPPQLTDSPPPTLLEPTDTLPLSALPTLPLVPMDFPPFTLWENVRLKLNLKQKPRLNGSTTMVPLSSTTMPSTGPTLSLRPTPTALDIPTLTTVTLMLSVDKSSGNL